MVCRLSSARSAMLPTKLDHQWTKNEYSEEKTELPFKYKKYEPPKYLPQDLVNSCNIPIPSSRNKLQPWNKNSPGVSYDFINRVSAFDNTMLMDAPKATVPVYNRVHKPDLFELRPAEETITSLPRKPRPDGEQDMLDEINLGKKVRVDFEPLKESIAKSTGENKTTLDKIKTAIDDASQAQINELKNILGVTTPLSGDINDVKQEIINQFDNIIQSGIDPANKKQDQIIHYS